MKSKNKVVSFVLYVLFFLALIAGDQVVKYITDLKLSPLGSTYPVIQDVFHFTSVHNTGAAFSMFSNSFVFLIIIRIIACGVITYCLIHYNNKLHTLIRIYVVMILAGAVGNLIDQIVIGYVRDMFDFRLINFAVFNMADTYISIAFVLFAFDILFGKGKKLFDQMGKSQETEKEENTIEK